MFNGNSFSDLDTLFRKINSIGNDLSKGVTFETSGFNPRVNIFEVEDGISVNVELAGVNKEDVNISINDDNILTIKGERKKKEESETKSFIRKEIVYGSFSRSFVLPDELDTEKIKAKYTNGVLEIMVPKKEPVAPKEINIQIQ